MLNGIVVLSLVEKQVEPFELNISITVAVIIALMSLISPIVVAKINNKFQSKQRGLERKHELEKKEEELKAEAEKQRIEYAYKTEIHRYDSYYKNQTLAYEQLLKTVGDYIGDKSDLGKYQIALSGIYRAQAYADESLASELEHLLSEIINIEEGESEADRKGSYYGAISQLGVVARKMNSIMRKNANIET